MFGLALPLVIAIGVAVAGLGGSLTFGYKLIKANAVKDELQANLQVCAKNNETLQLNVYDLRQSIMSQNIAVEQLKAAGDLAKERAKAAKAIADAQTRERLKLIDRIKNITPTAEGVCQRAEEILRESFK